MAPESYFGLFLTSHNTMKRGHYSCHLELNKILNMKYYNSGLTTPPHNLSIKLKNMNSLKILKY